MSFNPHLGLEKGEFITKNFGLVRKVANRFRERARAAGIDYGELLSVGGMGMMKAYDQYNPEKSVRTTDFAAYGSVYISGVIRHYLRDTSPFAGVKFTRTVKELANKIYNGNFDERTTKEIAKELEVSLDQVEQAFYYLRNRVPNSMQDIIYESESDSITREELVSTQDDVSSIYVEDWLKDLPDKERFMFEATYIQGLSQREIGEIIGVSQMHVCRMIKRIKAKLLEKLYFEGEIEMPGIIPVAQGNMVEAKRLILETDLTPQEIVDQTGCNLLTIRTYAGRMRRQQEQKKLGNRRSGTKKKGTKLIGTRTKSDAKIELTPEWKQEVATGTAKPQVPEVEIVVPPAAPEPSVIQQAKVPELIPSPVTEGATSGIQESQVTLPALEVGPASYESRSILTYSSKGTVDKAELLSKLNRAIQVLEAVDGNTVQYEFEFRLR